MCFENEGAIVESIVKLSESIDKLGLNNAGTNMGALELLSKEIKEGSIRISESLDNVADAIRSKI